MTSRRGARKVNSRSGQAASSIAAACTRRVCSGRKQQRQGEKAASADNVTISVTTLCLCPLPPGAFKSISATMKSKSFPLSNLREGTHPVWFHQQ